MIIRILKRFVFKKRKTVPLPRKKASPGSNSLPEARSVAYTPKWQQVLTASLKANALAPAEEVILHAYDLYCEELNAPLNERRRLMSERFSNTVSGFARIQSLAPDMVERAAAKHHLELNRFVDHKGDF